MMDGSYLERRKAEREQRNKASQGSSSGYYVPDEPQTEHTNKPKQAELMNDSDPFGVGSANDDPFGVGKPGTSTSGIENQPGDSDPFGIGPQ